LFQLLISPIFNQDKDWDFGLGAGFYVNATEQKWSHHFRMYSYITEELPRLVNEHLPVDGSKAGVFGHSMGVIISLSCVIKLIE